MKLSVCSYFTVLLLGLCSIVYGQSTNLPTDDVHNSTPFNAYATNHTTLGRVVDGTAISNDTYGLLRENGLFTIYDTSQNLLSVYDTGFLNPAWVTKIGNDYWFGNGITVSKGHFSGQDYIEDASLELLSLSGNMTAGDYDPILGLYISDGSNILRADFDTGNSYLLRAVRANALNILAFESGVYSLDYMLQIDGEAYRNLDTSGSFFDDSVIVDLGNITDIKDVIYLEDRMIVAEATGSQDHLLPEYADNFQQPSSVPEPGAVALFGMGFVFVFRKLRYRVKH